MDLETAFSVANGVAMGGWLALLLAPLAPAQADRAAALIAPGLLAAAYLGLLVVSSGAEGGFGSLAGVMRLFDDPVVTLAGWLHYLAFDLVVGAWIVRRARAEGMPHWKAAICLPPTLFAGPAGFLLFLAIGAAHRRSAARRAAASG